jgi:hypothetical protein
LAGAEAGAVGDVSGGGGSAGGGGGFLGGIFKGLAGLLGGLFGFQHGGTFTVGGSGGPDSQVVAFRATPGEEVEVRPPGRRGPAGRSPVIQQTINITTPNLRSFKESRTQVAAREAQQLRQATRNL